MTPSRSEQAIQFLASHGWAKAERAMLAGDASNRRYERLKNSTGQSAVLMDADPATGEDVRPFVDIATHLKNNDLSAPEIYAADLEQGFLLLEDLGDDLFARVAVKDPKSEPALYEAGTDLLPILQKIHIPNLSHYGIEEMVKAATTVIEWYVPAAKDTTICEDLKAEFRATLTDNLRVLGETKPVLTLRDYHAENLLWLPQRQGHARVGLLDFQDAMFCHPAYDLASLLKDARRNVSAAIQQDAIERFIAKTNHDAEAFMMAYQACSAQRNLRIIGVFTRLCARDGKPTYPDLMPRVWRNLMDDLRAPNLNTLADFVARNIPVPDEDIIARIKARCDP